MPTIPPKLDAEEFAERLKEAMGDCGISTGRGAGVYLARKYGVSTPTAHGWLSGKHRADDARTQQMAKDLGVEFDWLYLGDGPKRRLTRSRVADESGGDYIVDKFVQLSPREKALLDNYRAAPEEAKHVVDTIFAASAQRKAASRR